MGTTYGAMGDHKKEIELLIAADKLQPNDKVINANMIVAYSAYVVLFFV